ncbi:hypothetical protein L7F22_026503 [Adiantum nelumboides]|nr:hypothetical protein [Adiantum nelumboides]
MNSVVERGAEAWGSDGHYLVCSIAQGMLTAPAKEAVGRLVPGDGQLASWCSWADRVKFHYPWTSPLHYVNTPPHLCSFNYQRDCKYEGLKDVCVAGAINNYTSQLTTASLSTDSSYNLTEALLFLAHFVGDIHHPLHAGFSNDKGGNTIMVHWFNKEENLHHVWDTDIIETALTTFYDSDIQAFQDEIVSNVTENNIEQWSSCRNSMLACPNKYAQESINVACKWAYNDAPSGSYLGDSYFRSRLPIVQDRIARAGVRLASILNNVFSA